MKRLVVDISDMKVSNDPEANIVTYALGSCLGLICYDENLKVGGMLHALLPSGMERRGEKDFNPFKYVDTGIPLLFRSCYKYGAAKSSLKVYAFGCGRLCAVKSNLLNIGKQNQEMMEQVLRRNGVRISDKDLGGNVSRTIELEISSGRISLKEGRNIKKVFGPLW